MFSVAKKQKNVTKYLVGSQKKRLRWGKKKCSLAIFFLAWFLLYFNNKWFVNLIKTLLKCVKRRFWIFNVFWS
jgi:hypothetical protein